MFVHPSHPISCCFAGSRRRAVRPFGFTLLEVIVVVVIMAIMATLTMPRLVGNEKRQFRATVEQVADLLTMYAQRQTLGNKVVGIGHDRHRNWIRLLVLDTNEETASTGWVEDAYVQPVKLPRFMFDTDVSMFIDGDATDASEYPLSCEIGQDRPAIQINLRGAGQNASISLSPYGVAPVVYMGVHSTGITRGRFDIDSAGRSREDW